MHSDKWFHDRISPDLVQLHSIEEILYSRQTRYQSMEFIRSNRFGKCLVLDGKIQSTEADEFIYHEALVQPAMIAHPAPKRVFIAGGGEGATLREVLSHQTVKKAVMVDIDEEVITACQKYLPDHSRGAFQDKRTELHCTDAREFLAKSKDEFDVIIIDLPDPIEKGPAYLLYTKEFYRLVSSKLTANGFISVQSGPALLGELLNFSAVYNTLKSVFPVVFPYQTYVPSFGMPWGFCLASVNPNQSLPTAEQVDKLIAARGLGRLKFYDGLANQGMFSLPKYLRQTLSKKTRLITDKKPLYIYRTS